MSLILSENSGIWFADLSQELRERYIRKTSDYVTPFTYEEYRELWQRISDSLGVDYEPHDCRRSASGWLRDLGLSDLAIGQCDRNGGSGQAVGFRGVGWENPNTFYSHCGKMNSIAIYYKTRRLHASLLNGLIRKILENK